MYNVTREDSSPGAQSRGFVSVCSELIEQISFLGVIVCIRAALRFALHSPCKPEDAFYCNLVPQPALPWSVKASDFHPSCIQRLISSEIIKESVVNAELE